MIEKKRWLISNSKNKQDQLTQSEKKIWWKVRDNELKDTNDDVDTEYDEDSGTIKYYLTAIH